VEAVGALVVAVVPEAVGSACVNPRMRVGRINRPEFTDLAVVVGPWAHWTEDDVEDLNTKYPEVLLGYRVLPTTVYDVNRGALRGRRVSKVIILDEATRMPDSARAFTEILGSMVGSYFHKIEWWYVHRERGGIYASRTNDYENPR
jgi:hypothetical protein